MTPRIPRVLAITLAAALAATGLGCGLVGAARNLVATAQILADFGDRLNKSANLTYSADYQLSNGDKVAFNQQPPNAAYAGKDGTFIYTRDVIYLCSKEKGKLTCDRTRNQAASLGAQDAGFVGGIAGQGFVTPELALGLVAAAALVPGAKAAESNRTIAGQQALCVSVTGLDVVASPGDKDAPRDFAVCVTEVGILASFDGTLASGKKVGVILTRYATTVDAKAFQPPAGAKIHDVTALVPTPQPS